MHVKYSIAFAAAIAGLPVLAQSASVQILAPSTAAPGETVSVSVVAMYDAGGAGAGTFGTAGLFGFGGETTLTGPGAALAAAAMVDVSDMLTFGETLAIAGPTFRAAGVRGFDGGIPGPSTTLATFDLTLGDTAMGAVSVGYEGDLILVAGNELLTFATDPTQLQMFLSVSPAVIFVGMGQPCGDQNGDGIFNGADFNAWLANFGSGNSLADTNGDGMLNGADFNGWLAAFDAGNDGPTCR